MTPKIQHNGQNYILYDADKLENAADLSFERNTLVERGSILGAAEGRGTTLFIQHNGMDMALRHYHRGGLAAKLFTDQYIWTGLKRTRAWREWHLLAKLHQLGLPVPEPVAAQVTRQGLLYQADILTLRIPQAQAVAQILKSQSLTESAWQAIGGCIRQFHDQGVYHADLNANNILLNDQQQVFILDFDRGEICRPASNWQQANIDRLLRSFNKIKAGSQTFYFTASDWQSLLKGYQS
ncbi:MAG: 3-deoxy-D-manno-octulosonic acid kinase [Calditrichaceae bacterium]